LQTGELRFSLGNFSSVYNPSVSPNSQILAASREDNTVKLWDLSTGELLNTLSGTDSYGKNMIGWAADGNVITKDSKIESVRLWNSKTGEKIGAFGAPDADFGRVESISTSADGNTLVIGYENGAIRTWDLPSKKMLIVIKNPDGYVSTRTQISADRRILVSRSQTNQLTLWNLLKPGSLTQEIVTHELLEGSDEDSSSLTIDSFAFNQEQNLLVCGLGDGTLKLWDLRTGELLRIVVAHAEEVESVVFGPDGKTLITASRDKTVKIWQLDQLTKGK
jgi:WD40 repeat protein